MSSSYRASSYVFWGLLVAMTTFTLSVGCRRRDTPNQKSHAGTNASTDRGGAESAQLAESAKTAPNRNTPVLARSSANLLTVIEVEPSALAPLSVEHSTQSDFAGADSGTTLLIPAGITTARLLVAILLPPSDTTRAHCEALGASVRAQHFVLCRPAEPASALAEPTASRYDRIEADLLRAVDATKSKFANYVADKQLALVGVGKAADAVAPIVRRAPEYFTRVGLIDGGFEPWTNVDSARFVQAGGKALLVVSTEEHRRAQAKRVVATVKALGTQARLEATTASRDAASTSNSASTPTHELLAWLLSTE